MTTKRENRGLVLFAAAAICMMLMGCQSCSTLNRGWFARLKAMKQQIVYQGPLDAAGKGHISAEVLLKNQVQNSDMVFTSGTFQFSGRLTAQTAGAALPTKLRFRAISKSASGKVLATRYYDVNMQSDGTIPLQSFAYKNLDLVGYGTSVDFALMPLDAPLPACLANLTVTFLPPTASAEAPSPGEDRVLPSVTKLQITYSQYTLGLPKGKPIGHDVLVPVKGRILSMDGNITLKGSFTRDSTTDPLPTKLRAIIKHLDSEGNTLSTDNLLIKVRSDGTIPSQTYPFSTLESKVKETLDLSVLAVDKDLPSGTVQFSFVFTAS